MIVTTVGFKYFSKRQLVASGALFLAAANTLSSFAENIETVIFLLGFVGGKYVQRCIPGRACLGVNMLIVRPVDLLFYERGQFITDLKTKRLLLLSVTTALNPYNDCNDITVNLGCPMVQDNDCLQPQLCNFMQFGII